MDIEDVKLSLSEEGYCVFPGVLDAGEAEHLEHICRERIDAREVRRGHATGGGDQYISLECALNVVPELAPLCIHPIVMEIAEAALGEGFIPANNVAVRWAKPGREAGAFGRSSSAKFMTRSHQGCRSCLRAAWKTGINE